ncbi:MAG TPA: serine hydrolase domain-containing protein, partial [Chitinophagaceae bacterium]|nr:serine hydrolase domain-containing protein [Chitinophagaceae bacterium]
MKKSIVFTWIISSMIAFNGVAQGDLEKKVDKVYARYNSNTPGAAVIVVKEGKVVFKKGYGTANIEHGIPITSSTVFQLASVSKQFTAFSIYLLQKQGKISLEDDIRKYFPEMKDYGKTIKIKYLLAHTSGIRDEAATFALAGWREEDVATTEFILRTTFRQKELNFEPGTAFGYCNTGYTLLAEIIKRVTGKSLREYAQENIFGPLGMNSTQINDDFHRIVKNKADSYEKDNGVYQRCEFVNANQGPSNIYTTVEDLAKWIDNFYNPKSGDAQVIAEFNKASLLDNGQPVVFAIFDGSDTAYHAKGQLRRRYNGMDVFSHGGHSAGYRSTMWRFPQKKHAVITLSNDEHNQTLADVEAIFGIFFPDEMKQGPIPTASKPAIPALPAFTNNLAEFNGYYYSDEMETGYTVKMEGGKLIMTHTRVPDITLTQVGENKFTGVNTFAFELEFVRNGKEVIGYKISNFGAKNVKFNKR